MDLVKRAPCPNLMAAGAVPKDRVLRPLLRRRGHPSNNGFSIRHTTRNFPNREGSKPGQGQMAAVALMDARSIAATAANGGKLTPATAVADGARRLPMSSTARCTKTASTRGYGKGDREKRLVYGPNIKDWPEMSPLTDNILLKVCSKIMDAVTTTDELIPPVRPRPTAPIPGAGGVYSVQERPGLCGPLQGGGSDREEPEWQEMIFWSWSLS